VTTAGWFLPDDYLRRLEHPMDAGSRILRERVGVDVGASTSGSSSRLTAAVHGTWCSISWVASTPAQM
jgi:hypothetical protein